MEKQLFTWKDWDIVEDAVYQFYNPVLVSQIGNYSVGTTFKSAVIDYNTGELEFYNSNKEESEWFVVATFKLQLQVL